MGSHGERRSIVERMQRTPDSVVLPFIGGLRTHASTLAEALGGRALRIELVVAADRRAVYRVVFTPSGIVELTGAYGFDPHLRVEGPPDQVLGVLLGDLDTFEAVSDGVLTLHFPVDDLVHFPPLRAVLAERIEDCARSQRH